MKILLLIFSLKKMLTSMKFVVLSGLLSIKKKNSIFSPAEWVKYITFLPFSTYMVASVLVFPDLMSEFDWNEWLGYMVISLSVSWFNSIFLSMSNFWCFPISFMIWYVGWFVVDGALSGLLVLISLVWFLGFWQV